MTSAAENQAPDALVRLSNVTKRFGDGAPALDAVSGEVCAELYRRG